MLPIGRVRYIDFALADVNSNPLPGRVLANWQTAPNKLIFLRNTLPCTDPLTLKDYGDGRYTLSYSPSAPGHDYVKVYDEPSDITVIDVEDVVPADFAIGGGAVYTLNEDFGSAGALKVTLPRPETYILQVYLSSDWENGMRADSNAIGMSLLSETGTWISPIRVGSGTFHIVVSKASVQILIKSYLGVG